MPPSLRAARLPCVGRFFALALACPFAACVPEGPSTADGSAATAKPTASLAPLARPRPAVQSPAAAALTGPFEDRFERADLGADYNALGKGWQIEGGRLCARGQRNRGVWLLRKIPVNARIEFDAIASSPDGDLKAELWGDGASGATGTSYTNATSYLTILGGWKNTKHVLARLDEHADDRHELDVDPASDDERARPVEAGQPYHFKIERSDGKTIEWSVNGLVYFRWTDPEPLTGGGHEFIGFNDWDVHVCFDNLKITPL